MDPLGDVLLAVHEDLGDDFFCMICTNMTYMCHILSHLALKNYFLAVLEKSLSWVMVVTLILESLIGLCLWEGEVGHGCHIVVNLNHNNPA